MQDYSHSQKAESHISHWKLRSYKTLYSQTTQKPSQKKILREKFMFHSESNIENIQGRTLTILEYMRGWVGVKSSTDINHSYTSSTQMFGH